MNSETIGGDSFVPTGKDDEEQANLPDVQVNPLTLMTSNPPYKPVDDSEKIPLESADVQVVPTKLPESDVSLPEITLPSPTFNQSVVDWVQTTTIDSNANAIERSPSLPSSLFEPWITRDRGNSTVSTLCDQPPSSIISDTLSSQQLSFTGDIQRTLSLPVSDSHHRNDDQFLSPSNEEEDDEDAQMQFLPVPESTDSEVDKKPLQTKVSIPEEPLNFPARSPTTRESPKRSPNVSFHLSVSNESSTQPRRRRRESETTKKKKEAFFQRSKSYVANAQTSPLHSHILRKQFQASLSMPNGAQRSLSHSTRQSSDVSDSVFLAVPSSAGSILSSERGHSIISDASGQSGIESTNLRSSASDHYRTSSITEADSSGYRKNRFQESFQKKMTAASSESSRTPSTQSLSSSSDNEGEQFFRKTKRTSADADPNKTAIDKRKEVYKQLMWLLEKKPTIYARFGFGNRRQGQTDILSPTSKLHQQRKSAPQSFVEFCSSFQSNNASKSFARPEPPRLYSSSHETSNVLQSLPTETAAVEAVDPLNQSQTSVHSIHSDAGATPSLINTRPNPPATISLHSSLHLSRRRTSYRRHAGQSSATSTRDRKNSVTKVDQPLISQSSQQDEDLPEPPSPLVRNLHGILNEHLVMYQSLNGNPPLNHMTLPSPSSTRDEFYARLGDLSQRNPMHQRCSRIETKAFIDLISNLQMNRSHHYSFLIETMRINESKRIVRPSRSDDDHDDDDVKDGHLASNESSNTSSPALSRLISAESNVDEDQSYLKCPLRSFRILSEDYLRDCEQTEKELTKLFDQADQQHILYCLKHVHSGHPNEILATFHRQLDALFVWYNLYYELTISVEKLSCLLRCHGCDNWPKLRIRSLATARERKAKRAEENDDYESTDEENEEDEEESELENEVEESIDEVDGEEEEDVQDDIMPKSRWPDEPLDFFSQLDMNHVNLTNESNARPNKLTRIDCYRNFVYYMDKRSYQVKYDGLARTLIERVAPVLVKTRLALLQSSDRSRLPMEQILAGLSSVDVHNSTNAAAGTIIHITHEDLEDKLIDTDNPEIDDSTNNTDIGELTIEGWLFHVLKSSSIIKTICSSTDEILRENWLELHHQLGLPSLLPFYFFIINVLLDVMSECLTLDNKPHMNNDNLEIDSLCRQQLVREAKLVLRDALATRLYSVRMLEHFIPHETIVAELSQYDGYTLELYKNYKQYLSTVCINRNFDVYENISGSSHKNTDLYYYVDEETSELIKEYYFSRDLTLTLGHHDEINHLCIVFCSLIQQILTQLSNDLDDKRELYYQAFAVDMNETSHDYDGQYSAAILSESAKPPSFQTSASVPIELHYLHEMPCDDSVSFSEKKKKEIIDKTRLFRLNFDTIKQRITRVCLLAKTLINDFSIDIEYQCFNYHELWYRLQQHHYVQVKISPGTRDAGDFDDFYVFVPPWLSEDKEQVDKLLVLVCSQQTSSDEAKRSKQKSAKPSFIVFVPEKSIHQYMSQWRGDILYIQASENTKLALNYTELPSLHLVVNRHECWNQAKDLFQSHVGENHVKLIKRLARYESIRGTFDQLPDYIKGLSEALTKLVRTLNIIWDQISTKFFLTEIIKFDERAIESKLVDLILYVYKSGFELYRLLYEFIILVSSNCQNILEEFISDMNEFFCEWCKCVTKKFKHISNQQAKTVKYKVLRPRWLAPGMFFLRFFASSAHLQLLSEKDFKKLMKEMPVALEALCGNMKSNQNSPTSKVRSSSASSTPSQPARTRNLHRRIGSGGRAHDLLPLSTLTTHERIAHAIQELDQRLEKKFRERKQIGQIFSNTTNLSGSFPDPMISLKTRNIDFQWRRGTRIGQGGAGVAFRAINCSNGSIVCMKEILLTSIASRSLPQNHAENLRRIAEEIDMIMTIEHPNIVRYFGIERYKRTIYICMEYCLSTVNEFLNDIRAFRTRTRTKRCSSGVWDDSSEHDEEPNENDDYRLASSLDVNIHVRGFVGQLLLALMALHEKNIVHCDVKGDNIFIANENGHYIVKLGDFNLSHRLQLESPSADPSGSRSTQKGTLFFKPPEPEYVYKSDIWALGCTIIEMLTGKFPWTNVARPPGVEVYIRKQLLAKKGPPIPEEIKNDKEACEFIGLCLTPELEQRPIAKDLLNHPYPRVRTDS